MRNTFIHVFDFYYVDTRKIQNLLESRFFHGIAADRDGWMKTFHFWGSEKVKYLNIKIKTEWYC